MYFDNFPIIEYDFNIGGKTSTKLVRDITFNMRFRKALLDNVLLYDEYDIQDGETPEIISDKVYGTPQYHWVILLANEKYNYVDDFPMSTKTFAKYIAEKYPGNMGEPNHKDSPHHYENSAGYVIEKPTDPAGIAAASVISNYTFEDRINESKRRIKLISPDVLAQIMQQLRSY